MLDIQEQCKQIDAKHEWHIRERLKYPLHPQVAKILENYAPQDFETLILQWPHTSITDATRVAYTRSVAHGEADRQTVTGLAKYLRQHFSSEELPDHVVRDTQALAATANQCYITSDMEKMIEAVQDGPKSCMQDGHWNSGPHPYNAYAPKYGWRMAYRLGPDGTIDGRCLCLDDGEDKVYVRSYKRSAESNGYSYTDEGLEAWLDERGYKSASAWPEGTRMARIERRHGGVLAPYLDGDTQSVEDESSYLSITECGELNFTNTDGTAEGRHDEQCNECGDGIRTDDGDHYNVGYHEDTAVCSDCIHNYTHVRGRHRSYYYVNDNYAVTTREGYSFDEDYLDANDIYELSNGDYTHMDNAIRATDGEYYHVDDIGYCLSVITEKVNDSIFAPDEDTWVCAVSGDCYHIDTPSIANADGDPVHADHYIEEEDSEEDSEEPEVVQQGADKYSPLTPPFTLATSTDYAVITIAA